MTDQQQGRGDWWCGRCAENRPRYLVAYRNGGRFYDCARCVAELRARAEDAAAISEISEIR